jgi:hypothetical protein
MRKMNVSSRWLAAVSAVCLMMFASAASYAQSASSLGNNTPAKTTEVCQGASEGCENFSDAKPATNGSSASTGAENYSSFNPATNDSSQ